MYVCVCVRVYVCVLSVFGESCKDVIGNRDRVMGGFTALYCFFCEISPEKRLSAQEEHW